MNYFRNEAAKMISNEQRFVANGPEDSMRHEAAIRVIARLLQERSARSWDGYVDRQGGSFDVVEQLEERNNWR